MKELTLTFTEDEYLMLAKMLNLAQWTLASVDYDDFDKVNKIYNAVCEKGFHELAETESFAEMGHANLTQFDFSRGMCDEMDVITDLAEISVLQEHLPYSLADRDFEEKYGFLEPEAILNDPDLLAELKTIQEKYIEEFGTYGVTHLRLEER